MEELLRFESPVQFAARVLERRYRGLRPADPKGMDGPLHARGGEPGSRTISGTESVGAEAALNNPHLAFSASLHFCTGAQLPRLEAQIAILNLVHPFPQMKLTRPRPVGFYIWTPGLEKSPSHSVRTRSESFEPLSHGRMVPLLILDQVWTVPQPCRNAFANPPTK